MPTARTRFIDVKKRSRDMISFPPDLEKLQEFLEKWRPMLNAAG